MLSQISLLTFLLGFQERQEVTAALPQKHVIISFISAIWIIIISQLAKPVDFKKKNLSLVDVF